MNQKRLNLQSTWHNFPNVVYFKSNLLSSVQPLPRLFPNFVHSMQHPPRRMTTNVHPDYLPLSPLFSPLSKFICNRLPYQNYPPTHHSPAPFKLVAVPTKLRSCRRTWIGRRSPSDASVQKSPYQSAGPRPPKAAASSDLPAGRSTPACCRNQPTTDNKPMVRNVST